MKKVLKKDKGNLAVYQKEKIITLKGDTEYGP